jgi:hypothetical protein
MYSVTREIKTLPGRAGLIRFYFISTLKSAAFFATTEVILKLCTLVFKTLMMRHPHQLSVSFQS